MRFFRLQNLALGLSLMAFTGIFAALTAPVAHAQADLGSISGTVTDASGAFVPKAQITVTNIANGAVRVSVSGSKGEFNVTQLNPADYSVSITAPGFATATQHVSVTVGSQNTFVAKLAVAGGKTEVVVEADDFAGVQLEKPEVSAVIETEQILSLPTLDRNPYSLVAFSGNLSADSSAASRGVGYNISGSRSTSVDILLDGVENTDLYAVGIGQTVPLDATQEIRIVTSNSGAEYGRGSGAVNVSTKSGTNGFHGSMYEFNRISTFASAGYNNNYIHALNPGVPDKPRYTHNQPGYSVGGPVKKDKLFFFSSTEWTRIRSAQNEITSIPTDALIGMSDPTMQSFFTAYGALDHPINGSSVTGATIQNNGQWSDTIDPAMSYINDTYGDITSIAITQTGAVAPVGTPDEITTGCADSRISAAPICTSSLFGQSIYQIPADSGGGTPVNEWITFNRADYTINQTTSMFVRYIQESLVNPAGSVNNSPYHGYNTANTQYNHNIEISLSKAFTPTLASATKLLGSRLNNSQPLAQAPVSPTLYINGSTPLTLNGGYVNFPGYSQTSPGNALPFGGPQNFIEIGEDLAWSKGKHQFTFGGNFLNIKDNRTFGAYEEAVDGLVQSGSAGALSNFVSGGLGLLQVAIDPGGAYPCYKDETGAYIQTSSCMIQLPAVSPNFSRSNRYQDGAAYANDSYKVSPGFTLNLGLRWEVYGPQHSQKASNDANFFFGSGGDFWDTLRNGEIKTRETAPNGRLWNLNMKQFAPKVGFAWDPFGNGKTSVRGGYGISYERNFNNVTFNVIQNPPNYGVVSFTAADNAGANIPISTNNFSIFGTGTGLKELPNVTLRAVDPKIKPAYAQNWSLSVERQLAGTTASVSYVGTRGIHNYSIANINRAFSGSAYLGDARAANRTNYQYSNINFRGADGDSYYHGLTGELRSADLFHAGLTVRADYTWSHSIDNTSSTFTDGASNDDNLGYLDPFNHALDRGSSDFDQRHRVATAIVWAIPYAKHLTGATKMILDNWTLSTTFNAATGTPFTMFDCTDANTVCPRASFVTPPAHKRTGNMTDISAIYGPNTYSYMHFPDDTPANYNVQSNPNAGGTSDTPICSGLMNVGCHWVSGMERRNSFSGPGSWGQNLGVVKDFKFRERYDVQIKGEFINLYNHANTQLNLAGTNDVSSFTDVLAYKTGNRNSEFSVHIAF
jgi:hypothetical protein